MYMIITLSLNGPIPVYIALGLLILPLLFSILETEK